TKGEYAQNVDRIAGVLGQAMALEVPPALVVFPETATSGYFVEGGVKDVAATAGTLFRDLQTRYEPLGVPPVDVAVGFYEVFQNHIFNSCRYASLGNASSRDASPGIRHVHRKIFLPTYGVFDEERFVDSGQDGVRAFDTAWGRAAILICEDAWHSLCGTIAALDGAQLILVPSASPARITADIDLEQITHARVDAPLLSDLQKALPGLLPSLGKGKTRKVKFDPAANGTHASLIPHPASPVRVVGGGARNGDPLAIDGDLV